MVCGLIQGISVCYICNCFCFCIFLFNFNFLLQFSSKFLDGVQNDYNDNMGKYFVVMQAGKVLNKTHELQLIFEESFRRNIVDIVVAVFVKRNTFKLYSYAIFHPQHCRKVWLKQVNLFSKGKFRSTELFPYKLSNFYGCPIVTYIRNASLFYSFNLTADGTAIESIQGVEANMIKILAKKLNFTLSMYYNSNYDIGQVYNNGTAVGPFKYLIENKIDILLGYYHYPVRTRYFGESSSYTFMPLVTVVSIRNRDEFMGLWITKPYTWISWLTLGLSMLLVMLLVVSAHHFLGTTVTWIDIFGLVLGNSRSLHIRSYMMKFSFAVSIFGIMVLIGIFQGRLYNAFNSETNYKTRDIEQLICENYTFLLRTSLENDIIKSLQIPPKQIIFRNVPDDFVIYEEMRKYPTNIATLTNFWDFQMFIAQEKCYNEFDLIPMIVILNQICAYMRHHSYLIEPLNSLINSLKFSGLLNKWLDDLKSIDKTNEIELFVKHQLTTVPKPMTLRHFKIVFKGLGILYIISFFILIIELIINNWKNIVKKIKRIYGFLFTT